MEFEKYGVKFEKHEKKWVEHLSRLVFFSIAAIVAFFALLWLAPRLGITEGGKISLSRMQLAYGLLSALIAVALYVWGVGNWSRFEPPPNDSADSANKSSDSKTASSGQTGSAPATPASGTPASGTPAPSKGAN